MSEKIYFNYKFKLYYLIVYNNTKKMKNLSVQLTGFPGLNC